MYVTDNSLLGTVGFTLSSSLGDTTGGDVRSATHIYKQQYKINYN